MTLFTPRALPGILAAVASVLLAACGGGGGGVGETATNAPAPVSPPASAPAPAPTVQARIQAATATADSDTNDCAAIRPFYWEMGDRSVALAGGSVAYPGSGRGFTADTTITLASATKWLYAAYVVQRRAGQLEPFDTEMLTMRSGQVGFTGCRDGQTVDDCLAWQNNAAYDPAALGHFHYNGGHMLKHASLIGLGAMNGPLLAQEMHGVLGADLDFGMIQALPSGGATGTSAMYARFLRKLLSGELALGGQLGRSAACASVENCPGEALYSPGPAGQTWHYSLGHWVEDDPVAGDGSFSSAGAFGFYPWIDKDRSLYGVIAREAPQSGNVDGPGAGLTSARCGRLLRLAWQTATAR
jgi:hypothetical protein